MRANDKPLTPTLVKDIIEGIKAKGWKSGGRWLPARL